eukprot:GSChrysophyteH1.ASY1.ANO1.2859.1 assembled CDS
MRSKLPPYNPETSRLSIAPVLLSNRTCVQWCARASPKGMPRLLRYSTKGGKFDSRSMTILLVVLLIALFSSCMAQTYPLCGDCWCATGNETITCPSPAPETVFSQKVVELFQAKVPKEVFTIQCNPYKDKDCQTTPAQPDLGSEAVCAYVYSGECPSNDYEMVSYASRAEAEAAGAIVTHEGVCGLCSTTQDLSIYLVKDFTTAGKKCAEKGLLHEASGQKCYEEIGLTKECAKIWNYDGIYDGHKCMTSCVTHLKDPNNGPPPVCKLNKCLQCDEDKAGPIFSQYAARTRRRSGLVSEIIRACDSIAMNIAHDPGCGE